MSNSLIHSCPQLASLMCKCAYACVRARVKQTSAVGPAGLHCGKANPNQWVTMRCAIRQASGCEALSVTASV